MKKLFKEVWKSFKSSKVILIGLIILIFLSSGVITLIFDVVNSYKSQYSKFLTASVKQDITMNTDFTLYGEGPENFYQNKSNSNQAYNNNTYLLSNQWEYIENENYITSIYFNTSSEYYNLSTLIPSYSSSLYVKTKDLSNLITTNFNFNNPDFNLDNVDANNKIKVTLNSTGNNYLETYIKNGDSYVIRNQIFNVIPEIYDTYDPISSIWTNSRLSQKLYENNNFVPIVIDVETNKAYLESSLLDPANSQSIESIKYSDTNKQNLFYKISSDEVGNLLGFQKTTSIFGKVTWKLDHTKSWILEDDITNYTNRMTPQDFFNQTNLPLIQLKINLPFTVDNIFDLSLPTSLFIFSQYKYVFTQNKYYLSGITEDKQIDNNVWTGYLGEYLNYIKDNNPNTFNKLRSWTYWTKDITVNYVDKNGNLVYITDENGNDILNSSGEKELKSFNFNVNLTKEDLTKPIKNSEGLTSTIKDIENGSNNNLDDLLSSINTNKSNLYQDEIYSSAREYKYKQIYNDIKTKIDKLGIRETLTINTNNNDNTVYQFINLGNSQNEINWNGIEIKQEVGKLIDTSLSNDIFSLPSNINIHTSQVPIDYVPSILQGLLNGISLNRDYINPMISFDTFTYVDNGQDITLDSKKIVWLTVNGQKDLQNIYGISSILVNDQTYYFILKSNSSIDNIIWSLHPSYPNMISYQELEQAIFNLNLNFAPFDWYGNDIDVVSSRGWARVDDTYIDKYSIPFQYLLPNADILNDYNNAEADPDSALNNPNNPNGQYGMEIFRDNLIRSLTLVVKPLISPSDWEILMSAINTGFAKYGFGEGFTPPPQLSNEVYTKVTIGILRDAVVSSQNNLFNSLFGSIFDGLNRYINPEGTSTVEEQQAKFNKEIDKIFNIVKLSTGQVISFDFVIDLVNKLAGTNFTNIAEVITQPSNFLMGLKELMSSINLDKTIVEFWDDFYVNNARRDRIIGIGDFLPYLYKNIYSTDLFKQALTDILSATVLNNIKIADVLEEFKTILPTEIQALLPIIKPILGQSKVPEIVSWLNMENPQTGYEHLAQSVKEKTDTTYNVVYNTINLYDVLSLFSINIKGLYTLQLNTLVQPNDVNNDISFVYDPNKMTKLEVDLDLIWYLTNYVFKSQNSNGEYENTLLFDIDVTQFLTQGVASMTEVRDDYNQIVLTENLGNIAIVNQAFLEENNKEIYISSNLYNDIQNLDLIDEKYKINVSGVEFVIVGQDFSVDYIYPVIDSANMSVNTKTQALVYVNQYGFDRIRRSNVSATHNKYFLIKGKDSNNLVELQTWLNNLMYTTITGQLFDGSQDINNNSNIYKMAYLYNESSLLNPERSLRLTVIDDLINNLDFIQKSIGIMLVLIISIVIIFVIRRYINSKAKVLGILKAQGYSLWEISLSICLFPLFVSTIGATIGYVCGLVSQLPIFNLLSIFWKIPFVTIPFNWVTFLLTLIVPIIFLCFLTILTTFWFLSKNQSISLMNGSMEVNKSSFANVVRKMNSNTSVKNKFSISLALGSIGKLLALFISTLFTSFITLFFVTSYRTFDNSISRTYSHKNYKYSIQLLTPTTQGGEIQTYYLEPNGNYDIQNMLYVPVGNVAEGYTYLSNYFKPGYNDIINKNNANGNVDINDTTTPHILTKSSIDLSVVTGGLNINVWKNLYNAIPESQRFSIVNISDKASIWMEWTQEGVQYPLNGTNYITRFMNFGSENEYLTLYDINTNSNLQITNTLSWQKEDIKINYFNYYYNNEKIEDSKFIYQNSINNSYVDQNLIITGEELSNKIRTEYRNFLVWAYNNMLNFDITNINNNKLPSDIQTIMPEYQMDYFITPGANFLTRNTSSNIIDETFTYLETQSVHDSTLKPNIVGYNENSQNIALVDSFGNNLFNQLTSFNEVDIYPLVINQVVAYKYNLNIGNTIDLYVNNSKDRFDKELMNRLNSLNNVKTIYKFKIVGISDTYINEEWITLQRVANKILNLNDNEYNGILSNDEKSISVVNMLSLYALNGYWSANNKIYYSTQDINNLTASEKQNIINTYRQLFYNLSSDGQNISLFALNLSRLYPEWNNELINNKILEFLELDSLNLTFNSGDIDQSINNSNTIKANSSIKKFVDIFTDDALKSSLVSAISQGIEEEYITQASSTINQAMMIIMSISFVISLTILIMVTSMIITENERNIAILSILGYINREKILMFFSIYIPIVLISVILSILVVWLFIPFFLSSIMSTTSILLPMGLNIIHILITFGIVSFIFALTCMISWIIQGRIKPIILLK